jgi:trimeric autotransporter adhesin
MKTKIRNTISGGFLIPLLLACVALLPSVQAAPDPAPPPGNNTRDGQGAMANVTSGLGNTAFGTNALFSLTTGDNNAAQGNSALFSCTDGNGNTALGSVALRFLTLGDQNVAIGNTALNNVTTGSRNTAVGYGTLRSGNFSDNTALGWSAMISNTTGFSNTATGVNALASNTDGNSNTANGANALVNNTVGSFNVAVGTEALVNNFGAGSNTAVGFSALASGNGGSNTAVGESALANTGGSSNIAVGAGAGLNLNQTGNNFNIDIGNPGVAADANTIRIGSTQTATFIAGISGANAASGAAVFVTAAGKLGTVTSSARFKDAIKPMDKASEAILALKPVMFRYKPNLDPDGIPQFGLVAEEVAKVNPDLVARDANGKVYTVRYEAVNAMLLNEFLKEHRKNEEQEATIARQQRQIEALIAGLQKVSAQVEMNRAATQMAENHR